MNSIYLVPDLRGTYILALEVSEKLLIKVKRMQWNLNPGVYLYFGSAKGRTATSLKNRLDRHFKPKKKIFWHIDYLTTHYSVFLHHAYININEQSSECENLAAFSKNVDLEVISRFGSSDCKEKCSGHLTYLPNKRVDMLWLDSYFKTLKWNKIMPKEF